LCFNPYRIKILLENKHNPIGFPTMAYIFLDESGDLGFDFSKKKTSKYFLITFLFTKKKRILDKLVRNAFKQMPPNQRQKHTGVLHAYREKTQIKRRMLTSITEKDISIFCLVLNKQEVLAHLHDQKHILYNYVVNILLKRIRVKKFLPEDRKITLYASQWETRKYLQENFSAYLKQQSDFELEIKIKKPAEEKGLQVVDLCSWSIFRKYEHGKNEFYDLLEQNILEESILFA